MLNKWFKVYEQSLQSIETMPNIQQTQAMPNAMASINGQSTAIAVDRDVNVSGGCVEPIPAKLNDVPSSAATPPPTNTPFRKKAITSIERTRKLSILLKHQRYLVSCFSLSYSRDPPLRCNITVILQNIYENYSQMHLWFIGTLEQKNMIFT